MIAELRAMDDMAGGGNVLSLAHHHFSWVTDLLDQASYDDATGRKLHSALAELGQLMGWGCYDTGQHVLRAMAHQAVDLGHCHQGLDLAAASMDGKRYLLASPRERALFGVVYARALGAAGQKSAAAEALITAEDDLASATTGDDEPSRVFFFGEASLAHETACTLRDTGDLSGASRSSAAATVAASAPTRRQDWMRSPT